MGERTRKRKREFKDTAGIMEAGGEGFIYDPIFRIKLGTTPILKNFKVRSYLNFMASLPMKRNPATGYFEFAETAEEITAFCKAYFYSAEPAALAVSQYNNIRINKAKHLLVQPVLNTNQEGIGPNFYPIINSQGLPRNEITGRAYFSTAFWANTAVGAGGTSVELHPYAFLVSYGKIGIMVDVDAATTITVQVGATGTDWYDHTDLVFTAAGSKAQTIMGEANYYRLKSSAAATITARITCKG